jgi:intracellular septation protein
MDNKISSKRKLAPSKKLVLDLAPLLIFFVCYRTLGLMPATAILVVVSLLSLAISYYLTRACSYPVIISTTMICVFGALTLAFNDDLFVKIRPTIVNSMFAVTLLFGALYCRRGWLKFVFDIAFTISDEGWRVLSLRWGCFFAIMAGLNELVWRTQSESLWVSYKVFGAFFLTMLFALSQHKTVQRHAL